MPGTTAPNGSGLSVLGEERRRLLDDLQAVGLDLVAGRAPGRDAVAAEDHTDGVRVRRAGGLGVESELEAWAPPRQPRHSVTEALAGERLPVCRGGQRDPRVRMQVIHVSRFDEAVACGVDGRRCTTAAVQAVVERGDHLVLVFDSAVDIDELARAGPGGGRLVPARSGCRGRLRSL